MTTQAWALLGLFCALLLAAAWPLGRYLHAVMEGHIAWIRRVEASILRLCGVQPDVDMGWKAYAASLLLFNLLGVIAVFALQVLQQHLPLNPQGLGPVSVDSALNTAVSFVTNTNWQGYAGESTMSYLTQMLGLTVQNFLSAATGIAVLIALIRGFARHSAAGLGNAWVDLTRATLWVLLPLCFLYALFLTHQGVIQNFLPYQQISTLTGDVQTLAMGPVASQEAIKMLGTNGGGFFNANSAHPFENPTALSNLVQMLSIFLIPAALCFTFGRMVGDMRQGVGIIAVMFVLFVAGAWATTYFEQQGNPLWQALGVDQATTSEQAGGNMEGKEVRFGINASSLFAVITTAASCGAVNAMHGSFTPLGGMIPLINMQLGEVVFGGVGAGLYGMLIFAVMAVFLAGLMIGRTPEYLGKKIEAFDMKMVSVAVLVTPILVLAGTALAVSVDAGRAGIGNPGPHGFTEVLYALSSAANNNGSAFASLSANTPFYNALLAVAMALGRFGVILPVLALAGSMASKKRLVAHSGTMPTHGLLFVVLLLGTVLLIGLLNYVPALALGPVVEHLMLWH
jgi:K+-transporting ATPase ATPase A chain